jgi:UDP-glucose 4-epimerase
MSDTVVVTGALGFLGSYIVKLFASRGLRVVGTHRSSLSPSEAKAPGLVHLTKLELPSSEFDALLKTTGPGLLVHCAGASSVGGSIVEPFDDFRNSVDVLFSVLDSVRRLAPACKVILVSSAAVYGNPRKLPVSEDTEPLPISPYGFHKLMCETLIKEFGTVYGLRGCSVRIFSAYGRGLRRQVLWDICRMALQKGLVQLRGTGDETRDFIHAEDIANGIALIAERAPFTGEAYNMATGTATRIRDLSEMLVNALGVDARIAFTGAGRTGDPSFWQADLSLISELGFRPAVNLNKGAEDFARWALSLNDDGLRVES